MNPSWLVIYEGIYASLQRGGWILLPIYLVGLLAWILVMRQGFFLLFQKINYKKFWAAFKQNPQEYISKHQFTNGHFLEGVREIMSAGNNCSDDELDEILSEQEIKSQPELFRHLTSINRLASISPLLGLAGTVSGMMHTFAGIESHGFGNPVLMADGISESLLTTQAGLVVAFPLVLAHNWLLNRADRVEADLKENLIEVRNYLRQNSMDPETSDQGNLNPNTVTTGEQGNEI